jgi:hypothetical protein
MHGFGMYPEFLNIGESERTFGIGKGIKYDKRHGYQHKKGKKKHVRYGPVPSPPKKYQNFTLHDFQNFKNNPFVYFSPPTPLTWLLH